MLVAVVGAGVVGLASIKNCLEEGFEVVAFEKQSSGACFFGGLASLVEPTCSSIACFLSWRTMEIQGRRPVCHHSHGGDNDEFFETPCA